MSLIFRFTGFIYVIKFPMSMLYRSSHRWCSFRPAILVKRDSNQVFSCEHCKIFKNTYFEKYLRTAASDSSYILHKKLNKIIQEPDWPFVSILLTLIRFHSVCHSLSFAMTHCHFLLHGVTRCHSFFSLSSVVTRCTTRCYSLSFVVPLVVIRCHSFSLVVPLVCLFINNRQILL